MGIASQTAFSVIVPTYRRPDALRRALECVLAQDRRDWEVIVADDGEGEGLAVVADLADERIRGCSSRGTGQVDARNAALARTSGDLVLWLDDDDWWDDPAHLSAVHAELGRGAGFFYRGGWIVRGEERESFDHEATAESLLVNNTILTSSLAYPRSAHRHLGMLDRELGGYCDWDFMLRMCGAGLEPRKVAGLGVCYAIHATNLSTAYDAPARRADFERFARKHGLSIEIANHVLVHEKLSR